ncbi:MAG: M20/M25/M40 family metallo-hydrolase, partial [Acidobacteria bacterium]|nr:M20/M25/M40 family metallo-hydrolase [Acidobacteriota bacterium]
QALTDEDRWPWLEALRDHIRRLAAEGRSGVVACSALKASYRDLLLSAGEEARIVYLKGSPALINARLRARTGHFFDAALLASHPELFEGVGFVLNEGGGNQVVVDETIHWGIEIDQKVPLWAEISTRGVGGHGAVAQDDSAIVRLLRVLDLVRRIEPERAVTPSVRVYFESVSRVAKGQKMQVLADIDRHISSPQLDSELPRGYQTLLQDTWTITVLDAGSSANVVPDRAKAQIDIRLLPGSRAEHALDYLERLADGNAEVRPILMGEPAPPSPIDTELWLAMESVLSRKSPASVVGPMVSAGTTDSRFFRERGVVAYGFSPFKINYYDFATVHGVDERIRLSFLNEGVETMKEIVAGFCLARP